MSGTPELLDVTETPREMQQLIMVVLGKNGKFICVTYSTFSWARSSRFGLCLRAVAVPFAVLCSRGALCQVIIP